MTARNYYAVYFPRGFANEFDVFAFTSLAGRARFISAVGDGSWGGQSASAAAITRGEARARIGGSWLSPGDLDARGGFNVYLSGQANADYARMICEQDLGALRSLDEVPAWAEDLSDPVGL